MTLVRACGFLVAMIIVAPGCAPDGIAPATHAEVCGEPGPVRILELDPERPLARVVESDRPSDGRLLWVSYLKEGEEGSHPYSEDRELWSVGECGEDPRRLTDEDQLFGPLEPWPELLLACREDTGEVITIDPTGERSGHVVFDTEDCRVERTPWGLIEVRPRDDETGALVLLPYPDDPWTETSQPTTLLDPIRVRAEPPHTWPEYHEVLNVFDDEVFAITPDDELAQHSLLDGSVTNIASDVREFEISPDRRWLLWQGTEVTLDDPEWPPGPIFLLDRESGVTTRLADAALAGTSLPFSFLEEGVIRLRLGYLYKEPERIYVLPSLASFDLPLNLEPRMVFDDGRWLLAEFFDRGPFVSFDPDTGDTQPVFDGAGSVMRVRDDALEILGGISCCAAIEGRTEGKLWLVDLDGERTTLAHRATSPYEWLSDGRLLTTLDVGEDWLGNFVVVDPDSLEEELVDERVLTGTKHIDDDDTILYTVFDGDRTGVWLAKLAPRE
jgi:hypothetical protein